MANIYDEQFKNRLAIHKLICDPGSADLLQALQRYLESAQAEIEALREANTDGRIDHVLFLPDEEWIAVFPNGRRRKFTATEKHLYIRALKAEQKLMELERAAEEIAKDVCICSDYFSTVKDAQERQAVIEARMLAILKKHAGDEK